jgi:LysR family hydrogen peroxide-inducible transcriptional activator
LVAVGETGHFGAAARKCNVSQPTLSTQLQLLEDRLQATLIERSPSGARPTPLGEIVIELARNVLVTLDEILNVSRNASDNLGGLIRLGAIATFGPYFLPLALPKLSKDYPGLDLYIREGSPLELEREVLAGTIDCALTRPPEKQSGLVYRELIAEHLQLGIPHDHPLAKKAHIDATMLQGEPVLTLGSAHGMNPKIRDFYEACGAVMQHEYEGTSLDALRLMVSTGMGLSLFPELYIASEFPKQQLVVLREIEGLTVTRDIGLVWRHGSTRGAQYLQLLEEFKQALDHPLDE